VHRGDEPPGVDRLADPDILAAMNDLPLQIAEAHDVVVDHPDRPHARGGEIGDHRTAEAARADHRDARGLEFLLAHAAQIAEDKVAGIAAGFFWCQGHLLSGMAMKRRSGPSKPKG